jgi:hypothetical protein
MNSITVQERRRRIGVRHYLAKKAATIEDVAASLVGLHSSDPVTVYLMGRARVEGFQHSDLERALYDDRTLLRLLGMRRTMFVVPRDLGAVMDAACTKQMIDGEAKRLAGFLEDQGIAEDGRRWIERVSADTLGALAKLGQATATDLKNLVPELGLKLSFGEGKKWGGQVGVSTRILFLLATAGAIVRARPLGSWASSQYRWARIEDWLGAELPSWEPAQAQADLVARWLTAYGPGTLTDIKWWTRWTIRTTRAALERCGAVTVDLDGQEGYVLPDDLETTAPEGRWAAFLPGLDSTIMGWKERGWYLGSHAGELFDRNGNAGPTIWLDGAVVGGWSQGSDGEIRYRVLEDVTAGGLALIEQEAADLEKWLAEHRFTPRFRTPLEKELSG